MVQKIIKSANQNSRIQEQIAERKRQLSNFEAKIRQIRQQEQSLSLRETKLTDRERRLIRETAFVPLTTKRQFFLSKSVGSGRVGERAKKIRREKLLFRKKGLSEILRLREQIFSKRIELKAQIKRANILKEKLSKAKQFKKITKRTIFRFRKSRAKTLQTLDPSQFQTLDPSQFQTKL